MRVSKTQWQRDMKADATDFRLPGAPLLYGTFSQANQTSTLNNHRASSRASGDSPWFSKAAAERPAREALAHFLMARAARVPDVASGCPALTGVRSQSAGCHSGRSLCRLFSDLFQLMPRHRPQSRMFGVASRDARGLRVFGDGRCCLSHDQLEAEADTGGRRTLQDSTHQQPA